MAEAAIDIYGYRQRYKYSVCTCLCACVVYRNLQSFCLKPVQKLVCLAEASVSLPCCSVSPRLFKLCISTHLSQKQSSGTAASDITALVFRHIASEGL